MQQPMSQHDQMTAQQAQQQMVLCPVRLVYETQILVQPGDQIQPNQTLFINPQNPPPWAQNRQVQNPVVYMQQIGNNLVPIQQHMDQQQLYLQQYQNYQQIIPQQMIQNQQEHRPNQIQLPNLIHQNMLTNFQTNIGQNIQMQDRSIQQINFAQNHPNVGTNIQMPTQAQVNIANSNMIRQNETTMPNVIQVSQQNQINQRVEVKQTYQHANIGQINQQMNIARTQPQVLTVNPMQNSAHTINIQTFGPNMINRPIKTENVSSQASMPTFVNAAQNTQITRIRKVAPTHNMNKMNTQNVGIRNVTQAYRPIQPRPQFRHHMPPIYPINNQVQANTQTPSPIINQNAININLNIPTTQPEVPIQHIPMQQQNTVPVKPEENTRKRKSESPDEIHKKMASIQVNTNAPIKQINIVQSTEKGTNTSPTHRKEEKISMPSLSFTREAPQIKSKPPDANNMTILIQNVQNAIQVDRVNMTKPNEDQKDSVQNNVTDKEKLVRNTVFTQARGRVLTDKELHNTAVVNEITISPKDDNANVNKDSKPLVNIKMDTIQPVANNEIKVENDKTFKIPNAVTIAKVTESVKVETDKSFNITNVVKSDKNVDVNNKVETKEREMNVSLNTTNNKGMFPMEKCEQEKDFILTHVLDGIVIQESNVAFPIREPLTRRSMQPSQGSERKTRKSNKSVKEKKEVLKVEKRESTPTPMKTSDEDIKISEATQRDSDNPFSSITPAILKSWTTPELSAHLTKHSWDETASLFQDHEIDGESLFLVSKSQLQNIGVKEHQAEVICAFVKS